MPTWNNENELCRLTGSLQQVAYARPVCFTEGRASGLRAVEVKNGPLFFRVLTDKCLDIEEFSWKGMSFDFLSKPGLQGRNHYDTGPETLRSIMGGFMFTSGLENICPACTVDGVDYPMHGRIRTTPAEHVGCDASWEDDRYVLRVRGEMREAELFGENMMLRREITTVYGEPTVTIEDTIVNQSVTPTALMLLYHINIGYPLLRAGAILECPTMKVRGREELSQKQEADWGVITNPVDEQPEYVFMHTLAARSDGTTLVVFRNDELEQGLQLEFSIEQLPYFMEWKSMGSGDYVIGLEPATASVYGRAYHARENTVPMLEPFGQKKTKLTFTVLEGKDALDAASAQVKTILHEKR